jgi:uncharacterized phage protein gp47/JayE
MGLIPAPDLDIRNEEKIAAQVIARVSGGLSVERINSLIATMRELIPLIESGTLAPPLCPELTNANPSSPHVVLLEAQAWLLSLQARNINQLPRKVEIEFARLFGIELREASKAITTLQFTVNPPDATNVTIPAGTQVSTQDGSYIFTTNSTLLIPSGTLTATVTATRSVAGTTLLSPNTLTRITDLLAWVESVTNLAAVDSGTDDETIDAALDRARNYQRRGKRLVSANDLEDAILEDVLLGNGIVRAFNLIKQGQWDELHAGHTTVVVMTRTANPVSDDVKHAINDLMSQAVGNQFIYLQDPLFVDFEIGVDVRLTGLASQSATIAAIEANLRKFYAAKATNFGRPILRAEIITVIEGTQGVDRIVAQLSGDILAAPLADIDVAPYELPRLGDVAIDVVP